jgi:hypothetical protein
MQIDNAAFDDSLVKGFLFSYLHRESEAEPCGDLNKPAGLFYVTSCERQNGFLLIETFRRLYISIRNNFNESTDVT